MTVKRAGYVLRGEKKMKVVLVLVTLGLIYFMVQNRFDDKYQQGYKDGMKSALKTNPPSEELEITCAGLWVGEQNKKWFSR